MLLDALSILVASLTVVTVAGPISAPENVSSSPISHVSVPSTSASQRSIDLPARLQPSTVTSAPMIPHTSLSSITGTPLLHALTAMPPTAVTVFVEENPQLLYALLDAPPAATQVSGWWAGLDDVARHNMALSAPELVGNLDGIPYAVRNDVNRSELRSTIRELELEGLDAGRAIATQNLNRLQMLYSIADALGPASANPRRSLITLDTHDEGKASIVLGDLETADYVSILVPGMFISVSGNVVEWTDTAARLYDEQVSWLSLLAEAGAAPEVETVATVAWIGYQTPHLLNVGSLDLAYEGRDAIAATIDGLQTLRGDDQPFVSLLAHSYGSTAALMALEQSTVVDALAMMGSPGSPAQSIHDLNVRGDVFVAEAAWDPIPNSSFFGSDPGATEYGARAMSVAGAVDVITNRILASSTGHNEYFSPGTESMRNLALIGIDKGELVTDGSQRDAGRTLALLR